MTIVNNQSLTDEEKSQLSEMINDCAKTINKENKFKIPSGINDHFLPPMEEILGFFNIKVDARAFYKAILKNDIKVPTISHGSLHQLNNGGVGKGVFYKFMGVMTAALNGMLGYLLPKQEPWVERALHLNTNAGYWLGMTLSYENMKKKPTFNQQELSNYQCLADFIRYRCHQDIINKEQCRQKILAEEIDVNNKLLVWDTLILPIYRQHTQLSEPVFTMFRQALEGVDLDSYSVPQKAEFLQRSFEIQYDFLLNCIACYEVGYVAHMLELTNDTDTVEVRKGFISLTLDQYVGAKNDESCFHSFLLVVKSALSTNEHQVSKRELASYIKINHAAYGEESLNDAQYNVLKKWFKQKDLPSNERLQDFFDGLAEAKGFSNDDHMLWVAKMALGFDALLKQRTDAIIRELGDEIDVTAIWKQALSRYRECYKYHFHQHFSGE
ncbi:TPA: hypothetical protein ACX6PK_001360 [Photobacterium damselae]